MKYLKSIKDYLISDFVKESVRINPFNSANEEIEIDNTDNEAQHED